MTQVYQAESQPVESQVFQVSEQNQPAIQPALLDPYIISIFIGVTGILVVLGSFYVIVIALHALKISVPEEVMKTFSTVLVDTIDSTVTKLQEKAALTPSPVDDALIDLAKIPIDALKSKLLPELSVEELIGEIQKRNADTPPDTVPQG